MYGGTYYGQTYYAAGTPSYGSVAASYAMAGAFAGTSSVSATLLPSGGLVFGSPCNSSTDFNGVAAATGDTCVVGNANTGYLGNSIRQNVTITASAETSVRKILPSPVRISQFRYKADTAGVFSTTVDHNLHVLFSDTGFASQLIHIRLIGVTGGYSLRTVDPNNGYATVVGATVITLGSWNRFTVQITDTQIKVFLNSGVTPEITYTPAAGNYVNKYANSLLYGRYFSQGYTGIQDIDGIWTGNTALAPTNTAGQLADVYQGYLQKYLSFDGAIVRPPAEGSNLNFSANVADVVSEGIAYGLKMAVQSNDQKTFILIDNWTRANLDRRVSTVANTSNNAAPTTGLNLMAFHYNANASDGKGANTIYDANAAFDADPERATALLWAHNRWGSSSLAVGSGPELITPNYMARALAIMGDIAAYGLKFSAATGFWYLVNDILQTGDLVQIAPDYNNPAAFKLFAQYDPTNRAKWNLAVSGVYDLLTKSANQVMTGATPAQSTTSGLNPDWIQFTLSTGVTNGTPSTYGDSNYGFNAFRSYNRLYDAYTWYGDASALAALRLPKTFLTAQWNANAKIAATYNHDGTNAATYERTFFYWADYWSIYAGDTSNTVAAAIYSGKLANKYVQQGSGSYYDNNGYAYFDQSWNLINEMQKASAFVNYGQGTPIEGVVSATSSMTAAMVTVASYAVTASFNGSSTVTGSLSDTESLSASFNGSSTVTGALSDTELLAATFSGSSTVTATVSDAELLTGAFAGTSSVTATMVAFVSYAVTGSFNGQATVTGSLSDAEALSASFNGSSTVTGALSDAENLAAAFTGTSSFTASLTDAEALVAAFTGSSSMVAAVIDAEALAGLFSGVASMTAAITDREAEAGAFAGTSTVTGTVTNSTAIAGAFAGTSSMAGATTASTSISAAFAGTSVITGAFTFSEAYGSYAGNGTSQVISLPFAADLVLVHSIDATSGDLSFITPAMPAGNSLRVRADNGLDTDHITALTTTSFTVSSNADVNGATNNYVWAAFKNNGGKDFKTFSYVGDSSASLALTGLGFRPDFITAKSNSAITGASRFSSNTLSSMSFSGSSQDRANIFVSLDADGFTVGFGGGVGNLVNIAGVTHYGFAFKAVPGISSVFSYTGTGTAQTITTGFASGFTWIKGNDTSYPLLRFKTESTGKSIPIIGTEITTGIIGNNGTGFTVSTDATANTSADVYYGFSIFDDRYTGSGSYPMAAAFTGSSTVTAATSNQTTVAGLFAGQAITYRSNLISNPSFETDLTGWTAYNGSTLTRITTDSVSGAASMKIVTNGTGTGAFGYAQGASIPVYGLGLHQSYVSSVWIKGPVGKRVIVYMSYAGGGQDVAQTYTIASTSWTRYSCLLNDSGTVTATAYVICEDVAGTPQTYFVDSYQWEPGLNVTSYFDGNTTGAGWSATQNLSTSTFNTAVVSNATAIAAAFSGGSAMGRTNIVANGSFETDFTGWSQYGGSPLSTYVQDTAHVQFGTQAMKLTASAAADGQGQYAGAQYNLTNLQVGVPYTFSVYIYSTVATTGGQVNLYHGSGGVSFNNTTDIAVGWNRLALSMIPGGSTGGIFIRFKGAANQVYWLDGVMVEIGTVTNSFVATSGILLSDSEPLTAAFSGSGAMAASITDAETILAAFTGTSSMAASFNGQATLSGAFAGTSTVTASIADTEPIVAAFTGTSSMAATLSGQGALSGAFSGSSTVTAAFGNTAYVAGGFTGTSSTTGTLSDTENLSGVLGGTSAMTASFTIVYAVAGSMTGSSSMTATPGVYISWASVPFTGSSSTIGALTTNGSGFAGAFAGSSSMNAATGNSTAQSGTFTGTSVVTAAILAAKPIVPSYGFPLVLQQKGGQTLALTTKTR